MKRLFVALLACAAFTHGAHAYNVTFDLEADRLRSTSPTTDFPTTGLILLVASTTNNTFGATVAGGTSLAVGSFLDGPSGDDQILYRLDLSATNTAGVLQASPPAVSNNSTAFPNLDGGDRLALYWFPTLTLNSTAVPNTATPYGTYQTGNTAPLDGSSAWTMPAGTATGYKLYFITTDAVFPFNNPGTETPTQASALLFTVVPEPSTLAFVVFGTVGAGFLILRRRARCA